MKKPLCIVCLKPCDPIKDRNSDGTFAHYNCLRVTQVYVDVRKEKK